MSDIFISYSSKDRARAKVLAGALERQGWSVWWDRKIPPGRQFSQVIKEAMDEARCVIVLWSKESVKSEWVQNEASEGARRNILVPALIDDVEIPFEFRRIQAARLVDWEGKSPHLEFDILLEALCAILGQPLLPQRGSEVPPGAACTITASAGAGGAISPSGAVPVNSGADQSFTMTPENGYQIADVVVDGASVGAVASHTFTNVTAEHTIAAGFAVKTYSLTATADHGSVTKSPDQAGYNDGDNVTLQAVADAGYTFTGWSGDLSGSSNPTTLVMDADKAVTASFAVAACTITASAGAGGAISPSGEVTVNSGADQSFTMTPEAGYQIDDVVIDGASVGAVAGHTFTNVTAEHTIAAGFAAIKTYSLTATADHGSVTKSPDQAGYNDGDNVTLQAVADAGYTFTGWSGDLSGSSNPTTLVMDADKSVTARFAVAACTITASAGAGGAISPSGEVTVNSGADQSFTMTPEAGYQIDDVVIDGASVGAVAGHTFTNVTADHTIAASFVLKTYSLTVTAVDGSVTKSPDQAGYNDGDNVTLHAVADAGYTFTGWSGDLAGSSNPTTLVMDADKAVTADFAVNVLDHSKPTGLETEKAGSKSRTAKVLAAICIVALIVIVSIVVFFIYHQHKTYSLTATAGPNGSVTKDPNKVSYKDGEEVSLTAVPNEGYSFKNWSGSLSGNINPDTLVMNANKSVTASFDLKTYSLTAAGDNGSVKKDPNQASYKHGDTVILTAVPDPNYRFDRWSDDLSEPNETRTLVMYEDKSVTASFDLKTYSLTAAGDNGSVKATAVDGSVRKDPNQASYKHGDTVTLEAVPNEGYSFKNWSGGLSGSTNPDTLVMDADKSVTASFAVAAYTITASAGAGGAISPSGAVPVNSGADQSFTMTPEAGYQIADVVVDGDSVGAVASHTFTNVTADHTIAASFAALKAGDVVTNSIGMKLVYIPAGEFVMGSSISAKQLVDEYKERGYDVTERDFEDQFPQHEVHISEGFWMGQTEVTQDQYSSVMKDKPWSRDKGDTKEWVKENPNNPAVYVKWEDANDFCSKLSQQEGKTYRLPTEAEWEYACRADTTTRFSSGDSVLSLGDHAWFLGNKTEELLGCARSVGQKKPNPRDLYDMHGNVWEFCSDYYDPNYYSNSPSVDPEGPSGGEYHVARGGDWGDGEYLLRCSARRGFNKNYHSRCGFGFRVVRSQ